MRELCTRCLQPQFSCYCHEIQKFDPKIKFVILMHPIEMKRRIATGRMTWLSLENAELIVAEDYTQNSRVNQLLQNPEFQSLILYPGPTSRNLTDSGTHGLLQIAKIPVVFVIDGTWATARKQMRLSQNLKTVPRICFTPPAPSQFRVRKQPKSECFSTIEAVHHCIELLSPATGFELAHGLHHTLLKTFNQMVERQIEFMQKAFDDPRSTSYRRPKTRVA